MPLTIPDLLAPALRRPVAVFGGGVSGTGAVALVRALGGEAVVYDAKSEAFTAEAARRHGLVVFSPGFVPEHPWLALAREAGAMCLGELDFASLCWRGKIIAITGTNGKTTLTEFLAHALAASGRDARVTGNVGYAFSQLVVDTQGGQAEQIAVCEVSSFQAEALRHLRADAVLWTNFAEDHLERHPGLNAYFAAKAELLERAVRSECVWLGASVHAFAGAQGIALPEGVQVVATERLAPDERLAGTIFAEYPQRENYELARAWWRAAGWSETILSAAARTFALGPHRLTRVAEIDGVAYWNDSKATNFHAVEAALGRFVNAGPVLLIAGGKAKGGDIVAFVGRIARRVQHLFLIGETRPVLAAACRAHAVAHTLCGSLAEAVRAAAARARPGAQVLLSPGFASFDQFRSYEDRGRQFEQLVHELRPAPSLR